MKESWIRVFHFHFTWIWPETAFSETPDSNQFCPSSLQALLIAILASKLSTQLRTRSTGCPETRPPSLILPTKWSKLSTVVIQVWTPTQFSGVLEPSQADTWRRLCSSRKEIRGNFDEVSESASRNVTLWTEKARSQQRMLISYLA